MFLITLQEKRIMGKNTSVSLGNYFENFVESRITEGRYKTQAKLFVPD